MGWGEGTGQGGWKGDGQHVGRVLTDIGEIAVKDAVVDQYSRAGFGSDHDLLGVGFVTFVGVGIGMQTQMRARYDAKRRDFRSEIVEIVKYSN